MITYTYTINGEAIELATNKSGWGLFWWNNNNWQQLSAATILYANRLEDKKYTRRAIYSFYKRHYA